LEVAGYGQGGEHDGQVGLDRVLQVGKYRLCRSFGYVDVCGVGVGGGFGGG
jgi:hypothetical protein